MSSAAELLLDTARRGELHYSIILHGPAHEELQALALRAAKTLNCLNGTTGDACTACERIERRIHPDVHFVEVAGDRKQISVDQIRDILSNAALRPYEGRTKVFIVDPASALTGSGSNALLKTLEEPARDTIFILLTRSPDLLLPTIRSRSQSIYVGGEEAHDEELEAFLRDALMRFATRHEPAALLSAAAEVSQRDEIADAIALLGSVLCDAAAGRVNGVSGVVPRERLLAAADAAMAALRNLAVNADARLVVEQALAELVV
ncbi:MAG TPA: DNA polymerase III subunit [Thermoanaerobaculia bacterium]|nr:DNA polymerase III subunit [Thermoanaerobaculia bacterium]